MILTDLSRLSASNSSELKPASPNPKPSQNGSQSADLDRGVVGEDDDDDDENEEVGVKTTNGGMCNLLGQPTAMHWSDPADCRHNRKEEETQEVQEEEQEEQVRSRSRDTANYAPARPAVDALPVWVPGGRTGPV